MGRTSREASRCALVPTNLARFMRCRNSMSLASIVRQHFHFIPETGMTCWRRMAASPACHFMRKHYNECRCCGTWQEYFVALLIVPRTIMPLMAAFGCDKLQFHDIAFMCKLAVRFIPPRKCFITDKPVAPSGGEQWHSFHVSTDFDSHANVSIATLRTKQPTNKCKAKATVQDSMWLSATALLLGLWKNWKCTWGNTYITRNICL